MTTVFGAAIPCRRAARLGVSPTTPRSWGLPGADEIADYDQAGRHADAHLERLLDTQPADSFNKRQPGPHRALGIVPHGLGDSRNR